MIGETRASRRELRSQRGLRFWLTERNLAYFYGLFAVLAVAAVQLFFSLQKGGFFTEQWYWGVAVIVVALVGAALVPGYFSTATVGRMQWVLAGTLLLLLAVVAASILWSIAPEFSILEASRTAMYVGAFILLLPAVSRWGSVVIDAVIFGAFLPPAVYGLLQKLFPTSTVYSGYRDLETDPKVSSTVGYHAAFGMMCAMGALLVIAKVGTFRSVPLRAFYSATGVLFLVALYFSFSRGAVLAIAVGAVVLLVLSEKRFEVLGNFAVTVLPALWVASQAREYPGLVARPVSFEVMERDGLALLQPLLVGVLFASVGQVLLTIFIRAFVNFIPEVTRGTLKIAGTGVIVVLVAGGLFLGWSAAERAGGYDELRNQVTTRDSQPEAKEFASDTTQRFSSVNAAGRIAEWKVAWENWREHPLTGTGADTYRVVHFEKTTWWEAQPVQHAHSIWMSLLSDTGVFAFLAFAAFAAGCLALATYNALFTTGSNRSRALIAGSTAAVTAYLVSSSIDWNWYIPASTVPFFALAAVAVTKMRYRRERSNGS